MHGGGEFTGVCGSAMERRIGVRSATPLAPRRHRAGLWHTTYILHDLRLSQLRPPAWKVAPSTPLLCRSHSCPLGMSLRGVQGASILTQLAGYRNRSRCRSR